MHEDMGEGSKRKKIIIVAAVATLILAAAAIVVPIAFDLWNAETDEPEVSPKGGLIVQENSFKLKSGSEIVRITVDGTSRDCLGSCALDDDTETCWAAGAGEEGERLILISENSKDYRITGFVVRNGCQASLGEYYGHFGRAREISLYCDGKFVETFEVADRADEQNIKLDEAAVGAYFELIVEDSYKGAESDVVCVSELRPYT